MGYFRDFWSQMEAVTKKNLKLKARRKGFTFVECACPPCYTALAIIALFIIPVDDVLQKQPFWTRENVTMSVNSHGSMFSSDPFPDNCWNFGAQDDRTLGEEGDEGFDWRYKHERKSRDDKRDYFNSKEVDYDKSVDMRINTTFVNWLLHGGVVPDTIKTLTKSFLKNPELTITTGTFAVGPGADNDKKSIGYRIKRYMESRAKNGTLSLIPAQIKHIHKCFRKINNNHKRELCFEMPDSCLESCEAFDPDALCEDPWKDDEESSDRRRLLYDEDDLTEPLFLEEQQEQHELQKSISQLTPEQFTILKNTLANDTLRDELIGRKLQEQLSEKIDYSDMNNEEEWEHIHENVHRYRSEMRGGPLGQYVGVKYARAERLHRKGRRLSNKKDRLNKSSTIEYFEGWKRRLQETYDNFMEEGFAGHGRQLQRRGGGGSRGSFSGGSGECSAFKTACQCASKEAREKGCGWVRNWEREESEEDENVSRRTALIEYCRKGTRRLPARTSCFECADQKQCTDEGLWIRLYKAVQILEPNVKIIKDTKLLDKEVESPDYLNSKTQYCGAIIFDETYPDQMDQKKVAEYSIRLNNSISNFITGEDIRPQPQNFILFQYFGFMNLQQMVDDFITCAPAAAKHGCLQEYNVTFGSGRNREHRLLTFPQEKVTTNRVIGEVMPNACGNIYFAMGIGGLALAFHLLKEKELKIKEGMKAMGAFEGVQYFENLLFNIFWTLIPSYLMAAILKSTGESGFYETDTSVLFVILWLTYIGTLQMTCVFTVPFNNVFPGFLLTFFIVLLWDNFKFLLTPELDQGTKIFLALFPIVNLRLSIGLLVEFERMGNSNDYALMVNGWSLGISVSIAIISIIFWTGLYYYADQIAPKEVGIKRNPFFPLFPSYWREVFNIEKSENDKTPLLEESKEVVVNVGSVTDSRTVERGDPNTFYQKNVLEINDLRKSFNTPDGIFHAVDGSSMTMAKGQIFALLGKNGAGKTTTLSILTGLLPKTSGKVKAFGMPLHEYFMHHRAKVGICPQFSVVWPLLTVQEHLDIVSKFKGLSKKELEESKKDTADMLRTLGLFKHRDQPAAKLSGGQQRKLSLAMAFQGNPDLVFLDEPSSGMDTSSRRDTWDILRSKKFGRIIVLTTHFMEEADVLGDRIAIMDRGKIMCNGSPEFLKKLYQCGYNINCLHVSDATAGSGKDDMKTKRERLMNMTKEILDPDKPRLLSQSGKDTTMLIPFSASSKLSGLLHALDDTSKSGLETYSVGVSNLEEVFLKVAAGYDINTVNDPISPKSDGAVSLPEPEPTNDNADIGGGATVGDDMEIVGGTSKYASTFKQFKALMIKRAIHSKRHACLTFCKIVCPMWYTILTLVIISLDQGIQGPRQLTVESLIPQPRGPEAYQFVQSIDKRNLNPVQKVYIQNTQNDEFHALPHWDLGSEAKCPIEQERIFKNGEWTEKCQEDKNMDMYFNMKKCIRSKINEPCEATAGQTSSTVCKQGTLCQAKDDFGICLNLDIPMVGEIENVCVGAAAQGLRSICLFPKLGIPKFNESLINLGYRLVDKDQPNLETRYAAVMYPGIGIWNDTKYFSQEEIVSYLMLNLTALHGPGIYLNQQTNIGLGAINKQGRVRVTNHPLKYTKKEIRERNISASFFAPFSLTIALGCTSLFHLYFTMVEKELDLKTQQMISGVRNFPYWSSNYVTDFIFGILGVSSILPVLYGFDIIQLIGEEFQQYTFLLLTLFAYVLCQTPWNFIIAGICENTAFTMLLSLTFNLVLLPILLAVIFVAELFLLSIPENPIVWLNNLVYIIHFVFRFIPVFSVGDAMMQQVSMVLGWETSPPDSKSEEQIAVCLEDADLGRAYRPNCSRNFYDMNGPFLNVFIMLLMGLILPFVVLIKERLLTTASFRAIGAAKPDPIEGLDKLRDEDVNKEAARVENLDAAAAKQSPLFVKNVRKAFRGDVTGEGFIVKCKEERMIHAVQGVSFSIDDGDVFGLLGVNGAGKTTLFKMLVGLVFPTTERNSLITIHGEKDLIKSRMHVGYCPQNNPIFPYLTCEEHLYLYGRIKGIDEKELPGVVKNLLFALELNAFTNKLAGRLSGGNKRKLCVCLALIGSPKLIFLDEPSSGVDPMARRFMWSVIRKLSTGSTKSTVILTTHSMEEVEALCNRVVIMVNGVFRCIGPTQHLKQVYGQGFFYQIRLPLPIDRQTPHSEQALFTSLMQFWESSPTGMKLKPLATRATISIANIMAIINELDEAWRTFDLLSPNSPFDVCQKICVQHTGQEPTKAQEEARDKSEVSVPVAAEWWLNHSLLRGVQIQIANLIRELNDKPLLEQQESKNQHAENIPKVIGIPTDGVTVVVAEGSPVQEKSEILDDKNENNPDGELLNKNIDNPPDDARKMAAMGDADVPDPLNLEDMYRRMAGYHHIDFKTDDVAIKLDDAQGNKFSTRVNCRMTLAPIFEFLETQKQQGICLDYCVSHTSLEVIFNTFAKEQVSNIKRQKKTFFGDGSNRPRSDTKTVAAADVNVQ